MLFFHETSHQGIGQFHTHLITEKLPTSLNNQYDMETLFHHRLPYKVKALSKCKSIDIQRINPDEPDYRRISSHLGKQTNLELIALTHSIATYHPTRNEKKSTHDYLPRRRRPATPPGTAPAEKKPASQCVGILSCSDCREVGACGGAQVKTITIRLPDVEAAMLTELQKRNKAFKDLQQLLIQQIRQEYQKTSGGSVR